MSDYPENNPTDKDREIAKLRENQKTNLRVIREQEDELASLKRGHRACEENMDAEIDRLREENAYLETKVAEYEAGRPPNDQYLALMDENASLREANRRLAALEDTAQRDLARLREKPHVLTVRAENARLREILEKERLFAKQVADHRDRLREALEKIAELRPSPKSQTGTIARNALKETHMSARQWEDAIREDLVAEIARLLERLGWVQEARDNQTAENARLRERVAFLERDQGSKEIT